MLKNRIIGSVSFAFLFVSLNVQAQFTNDIKLDTAYFDTTNFVEYTMYPQKQVVPFDFKGVFSNIGTATQNNINFNVSVDNGSVVYTGTSSIPTLLPGATDSLVTLPSYTPTTLGVYNISYDVSQTETDANIADNSYTKSFEVTDTVFGRDNGTPLGFTYATSVAGGYDAGSIYEINTIDQVTSISAYIESTSTVGAYMYMTLFRVDPSTGELVYEMQSLEHIIQAGDLSTWVTLPLISPVIVNPGEMFVAAISGYDNTFHVGYSQPTYSVEPNAIGVTNFLYDQNQGMWFYTIETPMVRMNVNSIFTTSISQSNSVLCNGICTGELQANAMGGSFSFTYQWSDSNGAMVGETSSTLSNLCAGTYSVFIDDGTGNTATESMTITEPTVLSIGVPSLTDANCNLVCDGQIDLSSASGGVSPYLYSINGGATTMSSSSFTSICAGSYSCVVIDANNCTSSTSVSILEPTAITVTSSASNPTCLGACNGTLSASATGGTGLLSYDWVDLGTSSSISTNSNVQNVCDGSYELTVTDANNCTNTSTEGIIAPSTIAVELCMITVDSTSNSNVLIWSKPITTEIDSFVIYREIAGTYERIGANDYSSLSRYEDITNGVNPNVTSYRYKISTKDSCGNESALSSFHETIHLTSNQGTNGEINLIWDSYVGFSFSYYRILRDSTGADNWEVVDSVSPSNFSWTDLTPPNNAEYRIEIVLPFTCSATKAQDHNTTRSNRTVIGGSSIDELDELNVVVYPNPVSDLLTITFNNGGTIKYIEITNVIGEIVLRKPVGFEQNKLSVGVSDIPSGSYFVNFKNDGSQTILSKVIIVE